MATKKLTITLLEEQLDAVRSLVAQGRAASVSGFVQHAVGVALDDIAGWGSMLEDALAETGGPMTTSETEWADWVLSGAPPDAAIR